jgi:hypothetical protein
LLVRCDTWGDPWSERSAATIAPPAQRHHEAGSERSDLDHLDLAVSVARCSRPARSRCALTAVSVACPSW